MNGRGDDMLNPRIELAVTLAFVFAILFGLYQTSQIDLAFSSDLETFSGPRAYPGLILSALLVLSLSIAAIQCRRPDRRLCIPQRTR